MNWLYFFSAIIATFICLEPNENILLFDWIVVIYLILIQVSVPVSDSQDVSLASLKFCSSEETTNFSHDNVTSCQFKCSCDITHVCSEVVIFIATDKQWRLCEISALPWTKSLIKCMKGFWNYGGFFSTKPKGEKHYWVEQFWSRFYLSLTTLNFDFFFHCWQRFTEAQWYFIWFVMFL